VQADGTETESSECSDTILLSKDDENARLHDARASVWIYQQYVTVISIIWTVYNYI